jgi:hypothetical protein
MKYASSWRLSIALASIAMFVAFAAWPGAAPSVQADVDDVVPDVFIGDDGDTIDVVITGSGAGPAATLSVSVSGTSTLAPDGCDDDDGVDGCGVEDAGPPVTWDAVDGDYVASVILTLDCSEPEAVTVMADDGGVTGSETVYCVPDFSEPHVQVEKQSDDNDDYTFDWDVIGAGSCVLFVEGSFVEFDDDGSFDLEDNDEAEFFCEDGVDLVVDERDDNDLVEIDCSDDDGVDIGGSAVEFDINDLDDTAFCTWFNDDDFDFDFVPTVVTGPATSVSIVLGAAQINCGGSTLVQVIPRSASGGPAAAGSTVSLTSSLGGSFQPASSVTSGFPISLANFLYTAPDNASGTTTLTARVGNVQTTAAVQIVCQVAPATSTAAPLAPPSAGDGGLLGASNAGYLPAALGIAAAAVVLGLTAASRRFATEPAGYADVSLPNPVSDTSRPGGGALLLSFLMLVVALLVRRWR